MLPGAARVLESPARPAHGWINAWSTPREPEGRSAAATQGFRDGLDARVVSPSRRGSHVASADPVTASRMPTAASAEGSCRYATRESTVVSTGDRALVTGTTSEALPRLKVMTMKSAARAFNNC